MLKRNWDRFIGVGIIDRPENTITPEESHRLATAPLPAIRIVTTSHVSHALGYKRPSMDGASDFSGGF